MNQSPLNFPVDALPERLRQALIEAAANVQAPIPMLASAMLAAASSATQGLANVKRPNGLVSPISLLFITIAESGERKTACDEVFTRAIREFETRELEAEDGSEASFQAELFVWKQKGSILKASITKALNDSIIDSPSDVSDLANLQAKLACHFEEEPARTRLLQMLIQDSTPEGIMNRVQIHCPLLFLNCDEGGKVLNSYLAHSLTLLNSMRDGSAQYHDRKTTDRQIVPFVRLSSHIQAQPKTIQRFFEKQGDLSRDNGFLARNWITYPHSTQGFRFIGAGPLSWPDVNRFNQRISELLTETKHFRSSNTDNLPEIEFNPEAACAWTSFFNCIEGHQQPNQIYSGIRDAASKTAENVARLAAILHKFEGHNGSIALDTIQRAISIGAWYLESFRLIFDPPAIPQQVLDAQALEGWMFRHYQHTSESIFRKNFLLQHGPLRSKATLDPALATLVANGRAIVYSKHKTTFVSLQWQSPTAQPLLKPGYN